MFAISFFVESARGDVQEAVSTYYESGGEEAGEAEAAATATATATAAAAAAPAAAGAQPDAPPGGPRTLSGEPAPEMPSGWGASASSSTPAGKGPSVTRGGAGSGSGRFATLSDYRAEEQGRGGGRGGGGGNDDDDDDDGGPDPANFFTGGERSGLSVQNPDHARNRGQAPDLVQHILKKAAEAGQRRMEGGDGGDDDDAWGRGGPSRGGGSAQGGARQAPSFGGQGRTIGDSGGDAAGANESTSATAATAAQPSVPGAFGAAVAGGRGAGAAGGDDDEGEEEVAIRNITFWQDGFSIADGPLMRYDDPQHAETLRLINSNRAPLHLLNVRFDQPVELRVEQRTNEKFTPPPPPPAKPFGGEGNRLGSPAPALGGASLSSSAATTSASAPAAAPDAGATAAPPSVKVDESQPTTQLQIRLGDGQRLAGRFNHAHTVGDVRRYIDESHPGMAARPYVLQASFPPKPVADEAQSLKDAGLVNAVVIQKWT